MGKDLSKVETTILFCDGGSCQKAGGELAVRNVRAYLRNNDLMDSVHTIKTRCNGRCEDAPTLIVQEGGCWYKKIDGITAVEIAKSHIEENQPIEKYLLYKPGFDQVKSDKERPQFKLKPFESKLDPELGQCLITKGFSSDQYLHPLFLHLLEHPNNSKITLHNGQEMMCSSIKEVKFEKKFELELIADDQIIEFVIAPLPKDRKDLAPLKVSVTEYYCQEVNDKVGVRFKNSKGITLASIDLGSSKSDLWNYCTEVQLQGLQLQTINS